MRHGQIFINCIKDLSNCFLSLRICYLYQYFEFVSFLFRLRELMAVYFLMILLEHHKAFLKTRI